MEIDPQNMAQSASLIYQRERRSHWDSIASKSNNWAWSSYYYARLKEVYQHLVPPEQTVLEIGCGQGDLLAAVKPGKGVGVDFSGEMICRAKEKHPNLCFIQTDVHDLKLDEEFDVIVLSDTANDLWDVQATFEQLTCLTSPHTRLIINSYSRLWELPLKLVRWLGLAKPDLDQNWLTVEDLENLLYLADFEIVRQWQEILCPLPIPILDKFFNRILVKLWPFNMLALTNFIIARPKPTPIKENPIVSVIVPARNEAGNISKIFARTPEMGRGTELVFVEGHSQDDTYQMIEQTMQRYPERRCKLFRQPGVGKGDAVRLGFVEAEGEVLMILDADLTVPPEDLPRFYEALCLGKAEFVNGVRLVYPMEDEAMRFFNLLGNKFFSLAFSWLLGQRIKDTLCGTKVLWKKDYEQIATNRSYFGDFDPFGDFDLIFGAARLNLKITDLPIRYRQRTYGDTNIQRWKHGWLLIKMVSFAAKRIKFV